VLGKSTMPVSAQPDTDLTARHINGYYGSYLRFTVLVLIVLAIVLAVAYSCDVFNLKRWRDGLEKAPAVLKGGVPPDFSTVTLSFSSDPEIRKENWPVFWMSWVVPFASTLAMSIAGTFLCLLMAIPLSFLAATNTTPNVAIYFVARAILNILRAIPELILGMVLVLCVGFGALPGVLALGFHSVGMVGKFFAEALEHANQEPIEALRAVGASPWQVLVHGYVAQVLPQWVDVAAYRWEYNFRATIVLGAVGVSGMGFQLLAAHQTLNHREMLAYILVFMAMVFAVDFIGSLLRKAFK
jgi:phosphonate transport system permease protein